MDSLAAKNLAISTFSTSDATEIVKTYYGITASEITALPSERDQCFKVRSDTGSLYVFKITNPGEPRAETDLQTAAMMHVRLVDATYPVQHVVRSLPSTASPNGEPQSIVVRDGQEYVIRLLTYLKGTEARKVLIKDASQLRPIVGEVARQLARLQLCLQGFFHAASKREISWDIQRLCHLAYMLPFLEMEEERALLTDVLNHFEAVVIPKLPGLRAQVIMNDFHLENVLLGENNDVAGVIDFGDMIYGPIVCDVAIGITYLMEFSDSPFTDIALFLKNLSSAGQTLQKQDVDLVVELVIARLANVLLVNNWKVKHDPNFRPYLTKEFCLNLIKQLRTEFEPRHLQSYYDACDIKYDPAQFFDILPHSDSVEAKRKDLLGPSYRLFYEKPIYLVKGRGIWLTGSDGKTYLDCYNNVVSCGHCHPTITRALATQASLLNTHTRYLHHLIVEYASRLVASFDPSLGLKVCFFTCTGSEANDLAIRIARAASGNKGLLCTSYAYHGGTYMTSHVTPKYGKLTKAAKYAQNFPAPNAYARHAKQLQQNTCAESEVDQDFKERNAKFADDTEFYMSYFEDAVERLKQNGHKPAAAIIDPCFMSDGILIPPPNYLKNMVTSVQNHGGLYIADEVQSGLGRTGKHMWGFSNFDVKPDIVTMGKPMGNGHPVGVVITKPEHAAKFATAATSYFNTFGGNPVSCAVGLSVLDVFRDERLQDNVATVGAYFLSRLESLQSQFPCIGHVRGIGLALAVELIKTDGSLTPDAVTAKLLVNKLCESGVLVSSSGKFDNCLKIRPPLVFSKENADFFVERLQTILESL